jgi:hypothetical protein
LSLRGLAAEPKVPPCGTSPEPWSDSGRVSGVQRRDSARSALPFCLKAAMSRCAAHFCAGSRTRFRCAAPFRERAAGPHLAAVRPSLHFPAQPGHPGRSAAESRDLHPEKTEPAGQRSRVEPGMTERLRRRRDGGRRRPAGKTLPPLILRSRPAWVCVSKDEGGAGPDGAASWNPRPSRRHAKPHGSSG